MKKSIPTIRDRESETFIPGNGRELPLNPEWEDMKVEVMLKNCTLKMVGILTLPPARGEYVEVEATANVRSASVNRAGPAKLATARKVQSPVWWRGVHMEVSMTVWSVQEMESAGVANVFVTLLIRGLLLGTSMLGRNVKRTQLERDPAED